MVANNIHSGKDRRKAFFIMQNNIAIAIINPNPKTVRSFTFEDGNEVTSVNAAYNIRRVNQETGEIFEATDWFQVIGKNGVGKQLTSFVGGKNPAKSIFAVGPLSVRGYTGSDGEYRVDMRIHAETIRTSQKSMLPYFHLMVEGNLGADPVVRELEDGTEFATATMYLNRGYFDEGGQVVKIADRLSVSGFGAARIAQLGRYKSGESIKIVGRPRAESYADADGEMQAGLSVGAALVGDYESNEVFAILTAAADPTLREFENGKVATVRALYNRTYKDADGNEKQDTIAFNVQGWARNAELIMEHVKSGESVFVDGSITAEVFPETETRKERGALVLTGRIFRFAHGYVRPYVKTLLTGHLGADIEVRKTGAGQSVANLSAGIGRWFMTGAGERVETTEWVGMAVWGKTADNAGRYLAKGSKVRLSGMPKLETYPKNDGTLGARVLLNMGSVDYLGTPDAAYAGDLD